MFCLMATALLLPLQAHGQSRYRVRPIAAKNAATKIRISQVAILNHGADDFECIAFANGEDRVVNAIRFRFTYVDADRHVAGFDTLEFRGPFQPGATEDFPRFVSGKDDPYGELERARSCQHFRYPNDSVAFLVATVDRVEFADGTVWEDAIPTATPVASTSPTAKPSR